MGSIGNENDRPQSYNQEVKILQSKLFEEAEAVFIIDGKLNYQNNNHSKLNNKAMNNRSIAEV